MVNNQKQNVAVTPTGTGDQTVITGVAGKQIRVTAYVLVASAATVVTFKSGSTALSGPISLAINGGVSASDTDYLFETASGADLVINQSVDGVDGHLTYYFEAA